jgi:acetyl-CoA C-acetyltransferase
MSLKTSAYIVGGARIPFVKSMTHYMGVTTQDLMLASMKHLVHKYGLQGKSVGDVALGAVMNSSSNWNLAREVALGCGLHASTPGYNIQRACGTSLEAAAQLALKIQAGQINSGIAGGVDTNSDLPIMASRGLSQKLLALNAAKTFGARAKVLASFSVSDLKPVLPAVVEPRTKMSMGQHTEKMVQEWGIGQKEQDELALKSHQNGERAYKEGFHSDLVYEFKGLVKDGTLRGDTTLERLSKLKPAFDFTGKGTLTAGNSSPLTDGSAAVLLASESEAKRNGWSIQAKFVDAQVAAVDYVAGEGLLIAPTIAVGQLLERNGLTLQDFDFYEIHEAFAGQVLVTLKAWESDSYCKAKMGRNKALGSIDRSKMNICGGSVALGHPFAATGARIVASLAKLLSKKSKSRGLISI